MHEPTTTSPSSRMTSSAITYLRITNYDYVTNIPNHSAPVSTSSSNFRYSKDGVGEGRPPSLTFPPVSVVSSYKVVSVPIVEMSSFSAYNSVILEGTERPDVLDGDPEFLRDEDGCIFEFFFRAIGWASGLTRGVYSCDGGLSTRHTLPS